MTNSQLKFPFSKRRAILVNDDLEYTCKNISLLPRSGIFYLQTSKKMLNTVKILIYKKA